MDNLLEKTLSSKYMYRGRIVNVRQDKVRMPSGNTALREVVEHPGAVAVLAVTEENEAVLVRQFRQPAKEILLEVPAGKLDSGEEPLQCAKRELAEETGLRGESWHSLGWFYLSPGYSDEKIFLYLAGKLSTAPLAQADEEENIEIKKIPLNSISAMISAGEITDAKTVIAVTLAAPFLS